MFSNSNKKSCIYDFYSLLYEYNPDQTILEKVAHDVMMHNRTDLLKILISEIGFKFTDSFIETYLYNNFFIDSIQQVMDILGDEFIESLDKRILYKICAKEFSVGHNTTLKKLLNFGHNINDIITKTFISMYLSREMNCINVLKFMLENNLDLKIFDKEMLTTLIRWKRFDIFNLLIEYGINIDVINNINVPIEFSKNYDLLVDLNIEPKKIAYILDSIGYPNQL